MNEKNKRLAKVNKWADRLHALKHPKRKEKISDAELARQAGIWPADLCKYLDYEKYNRLPKWETINKVEEAFKLNGV